MKKYFLSDNEHGSQVAFFNWVRKNRKHSPNESIRNALGLCYAIPNGLSTKQSQRAKMEGLTAGIPDIALSWPTLRKSRILKAYKHSGEPFTVESKDGLFWTFIAGLFIEMKHGRNGLSPNQIDKKFLLEKASSQYEICYSTKAAIEAVMSYLPYPREDYVEPEY